MSEEKVSGASPLSDGGTFITGHATTGGVRERFSKTSLLADLQRRADALRNAHDFDPDNGTSQLGRIPHGIRAVDYGRFSMLQDLIEELS